MASRILRCVSTLVVCALLQPPGVFGQSKQPPRKKIKDFGSSLKRLKWNPIKKETVETPAIAAKSASDEDDVIRFETSLVAWDVLVVDKEGNNVRGLTGADFVVKEDGLPQEVGHFLLGDNQTVPRTIVLIIDYSGSQLPYLRNSVDAAKVLVDQLAPLDKMAIVTDDVELIQDFTDDKKQLKKKLESLFERTRRNGGFFGFGKHSQLGKSRQYSALMATLNEAFNDEDKRPIIVFQTDGDEVYRLRDPVIRPSPPPDLPEDLRAQALENIEAANRFYQEQQSEFSLADVYRAAEKSRATIYTVVPGYQLVGRSPEERLKIFKAIFARQLEAQYLALSAEKLAEAKERQERWRVFSEENQKARAKDLYVMQFALAAVAGRTGGWTEFLERPEQASAIYARIFSDINQRYIIGYYPTNKDRDGKRRRIDVAVKDHPEYTILGRRSYYAPTQ
jgi:VWFA-related protein